MSIFKDWLSDKYTQPDPELTRKARATWPGMAHFAGTGPKGRTCRECIYWDHLPYEYRSKTGRYGGLIKPARCRKYRELTREQGAPVPYHAFACRHFELNPSPPRKYASA